MLENSATVNVENASTRQWGGDETRTVSRTVNISDVVGREFLSGVNARLKAEEEENRKARKIIPLLAKRCYHLPGYGWCDDWMMYMMNNHPLFGICCHHRLHPLRMRQRVICLIGSIAFGLAATNCVFLYYALNSKSMDETVFKVQFTSNTTDIPAMFQSIEVTSGMVSLWTFGGALHSIFDLTIWYISACSCCLPGGMCSWFGCCQQIGSYLVVGIVVIMVALATFVVVWRASRHDYLDAMERNNNTDDDIYGYSPRLFEIDGVDNFSFLLGYCVELALALFAYYPLMGTILFSGVLGCGKLPILGGRPREVQLEKKKRRKQAKAGSRSVGGRTQTSQGTGTVGTNTISDDFENDDEWPDL